MNDWLIFIKLEKNVKKCSADCTKSKELERIKTVCYNNRHIRKTSDRVAGICFSCAYAEQTPGEAG